jgi:hypothetical protein
VAGGRRVDADHEWAVGVIDEEVEHRDGPLPPDPGTRDDVVRHHDGIVAWCGDFEPVLTTNLSTAGMACVNSQENSRT